MVSVAHRLTKQIRRRSSSPQARNPIQLPPVVPITYAHAYVTPTSTEPPPSYIATEIAQDGGIRRILLPDQHPEQLHDPCGMLLCNCGHPSDPKPGAEAVFYQWGELKENAIPAVYGREHFVSSPTVVVENLQLPSSTAPGSTILFVRLPPEISRTRNLEGIDEATLLKELKDTMTEMENAPGPEEQYDHIYLHLLGVKPPKQERPSPPPPVPNPSEERSRAAIRQEILEEVLQAQEKLRKEKEEKEKKEKKSKSADSSRTSESEDEIHEETTEDFITPSTILDPKCPESFRIFWNLTGLGYDKRRQFVAPHFPFSALQAQEELGMDELVTAEFVAWAKAYQDLAAQHALGELKSTKLEIGVRNSLAALQAQGLREVINLTRANAPVMTPQKIEQLDHRTVETFFHKLRMYCLESAVPWNNFFTFGLSARTVGEEIYRQIMTTLGSLGPMERFAEKCSTYIERLVLKALKAPEDFWVKLDEITMQHVRYLTSANPTAEFLRLNLRAHASQLTYINPWVQQLQKKPTDETQDQIKDVTNELEVLLLHRIIGTVPALYDKLTKIYISNPKYHKFSKAPPNILIKDIELLIAAERNAQARALESA